MRALTLGSRRLASEPDTVLDANQFGFDVEFDTVVAEGDTVFLRV